MKVTAAWQRVVSFVTAEFISLLVFSQKAQCAPAGEPTGRSCILFLNVLFVEDEVGSCLALYIAFPEHSL